MQKIFWHHDRFRIYQIKQLLDDHDIPNNIKNEFAIGAMGELSPMDIMPEVWLADDEWLSKAQKLISEFSQPIADSQPWQCASCNEQNEANFGVCWQCGEAQHQ